MIKSKSSCRCIATRPVVNHPDIFETTWHIPDSAVQLAEGCEVSITDLGSTNGTMVRLPRMAAAEELEPMQWIALPVGSEVVFGALCIDRAQRRINCRRLRQHLVSSNAFTESQCFSYTPSPGKRLVSGHLACHTLLNARQAL